MPMVETLFLLISGHALGDFVLQPEAMGYGKNRNDKIHDREHSLFPCWYYWLTAHALVHGGIVFLITNSLLLGLVETVLHWVTDYSKCEGWIGVHQDQGIHIGSKFVYAFVV
ncbi:MAG: DUF3307 domain-containing protein [Pseudohongiellaceae bacterium]